MKHYLPVCLLLVSFGAHGMLSKWVDADGKIHYSDGKPPPGIKAKTITTPAPANAVPAQMTFAERAAAIKTVQKFGEENSQKSYHEPSGAIETRNNCVSAKSTLRELAGGAQISSPKSQGATITMDEWVRQRKIKEASRDISLFCKAE